MKKTYRMILAALLMVLGSASAFAADQTVDLEAEMFKAWDSNLPGANVVAEPEPEPKNNGSFGCTYGLYEEVGAYGTIFGNSSVYYLWYADLTGTKTMTVTGTVGMKIRVMMNRVPFEEGGAGDADGGTYVELIQEIGEDGTTVFDFTSYEYVHLNAIKVPAGGPGGVVKAIQLYGSVKAVSGWVDMLNNGDLEGTDLESFPVSKDGPNNGKTANDRPTITMLDGVKCMQVTADDLTSVAEGWTTWSTQFYFKFNQMLEEGTQWKMTLDVYADDAANITTSAQGAPRKWHAGFIDGFDVTPSWLTIEKEGTVNAEQAKEGGFGSVAFDLNNSNKPINFYFKNAHFYIYKEKSAMAQISAGFQTDVIRIDLGGKTNMADLVKATGGKRLIYPIDCATVKINGVTSELLSIEGRPDGNLWIFIDQPYSEYETDKVEISFNNLDDPDKHRKFVSGRYEGEDVPNFTDLQAVYIDGLAENVSYMAEAPELESVTPEDGSFNLPVNLKEFTVVFATEANAEKIKATFDNEVLTVSPSVGFTKEVTLTRTSTNDITNGEHKLVIDKVYPVSEVLGDDEYSTFEVTLNFGPVVDDPNDVAKDIVPVSYFSSVDGGGIPVGYNVKVGDEIRTNPTTYGSNACLKTYTDGGDFTRALYFRQDYVTFGEQEDYPLTLEGGKAYTFHFNTARWKAGGQYVKFELLDANGEAVETQVLENNPDVNGAQNIVVSGSTAYDKKIAIETSGNYIMKWTCCDAEGNQGSWNEMLLGNVYVSYVPNTPGAVETRLLNTALENAKSALTGNADERYSGGDYDELQRLINTIEAEKASYTAPSVYKNRAAALDDAVKALLDHHTACDNYDANIKKTIDIVRQTTAEQDNGKPNAKRKFMVTEAFETVNALAAKYNGSSEWQNQGTEEEPNWQLVYTYEVLKSNELLATANEELSAANNYADKMFTVGASKCNMTGYAVLNERIRLGIETLKTLGYTDEDDVMVAANQILGDDDQMAEALKYNIKSTIYGKLKEADNDLFAEVVNEQTLEATTPSYDMTVFVKNPNIYRLNGSSTSFTAENVPGWVTPEGYTTAGISTGWSDPCGGIASIPSDCMFEGWHRNYRVEQTITDLPAGVYTIQVAFSEREYDVEQKPSFAYVKTSTTEGENGLTAVISNIGQAFPTVAGSGMVQFENVTVVDGILTIGGEAITETNTFFNEVKVIMTGAAAGFDYAEAYATGIETEVAVPAQVKSIEVYGLNGQRLPAAKKGVVIVKKIMSDGTVKVEKVIK